MIENKKSKKGISLIVLVITIIVIIILAVAVILSISNNNPIESARKARFQNDLRTIEEEISLYIGKQYADKNGKYTPNDSELMEIIPEVYKEKITISNGKVDVIGGKVTKEEETWAKEIGIKVIYMPTIPVGFIYKEGTVDTRICNN